MNQQWIVIYVLLTYTCLSYQISTPNSTTYIAAVVEYSPIYVKDNAEATLKINSEAYVNHINMASLNDTDIIVFPEVGLTTVYLPERENMQDWATIIPAASDNYTPCTQSTIEVSETLKKISCAARNNRIYVVINIAEKLPCTEDTCPLDKMFYYNSNVVFDRTGKIIARYRKTNLFLEPQFNVTSVPEVVIFKTDFGVNFGTFICFDILFQQPAILLTRLRQITDIVYPTAWFSETPFLTAVQTQAGWSFGEDINLLASGYNRPRSGNTGSGIYLGRKGVGKAVFASTKHDELLIFEVPKMKKKIERKHHHDHSKNDEKASSRGQGHVHDELRRKRENNENNEKALLLMRDNIEVFETVPLEGNITKIVCQNEFCCEFNVNVVTIDPSTKYRLAVFNGKRRYVVVEAAVLACGVIQCSNDSIVSCGSMQESGTTFSNIDITATFHDYKSILIMPSTLTPHFYPLTDWMYDEHFHDNHVHISMSLNNNTNNLVTFGVYARNFKKNDFKKLCRYSYNDTSYPDFTEYRRKSTQNPKVPSAKSSEKRRAVKCLATFAAGVTGLYSFKSGLLTCVYFLSASRDVLAEARIEVRLCTIPEGHTSIIKWRGKPVFLYHRTQSIIDQERAVNLSELRDPEADEDRVKRSEWLIVIGICTHLGCVPIPNAGIIRGGFFCPCHGSHFDGSGRIRRGPADRNLEIPEYHFIDEDNIIIG